MSAELIFSHKGLQNYMQVWCDMQMFTQNRQLDTTDECWLLEHAPVFTQGRHGRPEHLLAPGDIPVVQTDRGGQVTYHGPGQLIAYPLIDLNRHGLGPKNFVCRIEQATIDCLAYFNINPRRKHGAPGLFVDGKKICSIGFRIRRGFSYHGLALNVAMDLEPFSRINPCGFEGMQMTQMSDFIGSISVGDVEPILMNSLREVL